MRNSATFGRPEIMPPSLRHSRVPSLLLLLVIAAAVVMFVRYVA